MEAQYEEYDQHNSGYKRVIRLSIDSFNQKKESSSVFHS